MKTTNLTGRPEGIWPAAKPAWRGLGAGLLFGALWLLGVLAPAAAAQAATIRGTVVDPAGKLVPQARVCLLSSLRKVAERQTDAAGRYEFDGIAAGTYTLYASAPGLSTPETEIVLQEGEIRLADLRLALDALPQEVVVSASLEEALATQLGASASVVGHQEIEDRGAQSVLEVLRGVPGVEVNQTGRRGGVTGVFIRGGNSNYNLVMWDGMQLNQFGGGFDFAPLAVDGVDRVEVIRNPESALYGSNAVTGVVNIVSRQGEGPTHFSGLAEGGSFTTRRFATGGSGLYRGWGWSYELMRLDSGGVVQNDNFRNQAATLSLDYSRSPRRQLAFHLFGDANDAGAPGPFGSDPDHLYDAPIFPGGPTPRQAGLSSRDKQNLWAYGGTYSEQIAPRFRQVVSGYVTTNDYYFITPPALGGDSFSNNLRGVLNTRSEVGISNQDFLVTGFEYNREQIRNTFIADASNHPFLLPRTSLGYFAENRWTPSRRWFVTTGLRVDDIRTGKLPPDAFGSRPLLPPSSVVKVNPRLSTAYLIHPATGGVWGDTRLHSSFGTGIRAPDGFELAFHNNPHLKPERSLSFDAGAEQRFWADRAALEVTYFYNRFKDQIVVLGGSLANLSTFTSANLGNSKADGLELALHFEPTRSLQVVGEYTRLDTAILALNGTDLTVSPFRVGQPLIRRPKNTGFYNITWRHHQLTLNSNAYIRGAILDLEPNEGAGACLPPPLGPGLPCLFTSKGYVDVNAGFAYRFAHGVELYGRLNNLLNQKYEESLGFPALHFNFLAGVRFEFPAE
jgi:outer membrane receptor protein involved in Fe transport